MGGLILFARLFYFSPRGFKLILLTDMGIPLSYIFSDMHLAYTLRGKIRRPFSQNFDFLSIVFMTMASFVKIEIEKGLPLS